MINLLVLVKPCTPALSSLFPMCPDMLLFYFSFCIFSLFFFFFLHYFLMWITSIALGTMQLHRFQRVGGKPALSAAKFRSPNCQFVSTSVRLCRRRISSRLLLGPSLSRSPAAVSSSAGVSFGSTHAVASSLFHATPTLYFIMGGRRRFSAREAVDIHCEGALKSESFFFSPPESGEGSSHTSSMAWNLLGDPYGGLNDEEVTAEGACTAEELSQHELVEEIQARQLRYDCDMFNLLFTPLIDIIALLEDHRLLPEADRRNASKPEGEGVCTEATKSAELSKTTETASEASSSASNADPSAPAAVSRSAQYHGRTGHHNAHRRVAHWFLDGSSTLSRPTWTKEKMGEARYIQFVQVLRTWNEELSPVTPLVRVIRRYGLNESFYVPFLRQLSMEMYSSEFRPPALKIVPSIIVTLSSGRSVPRAMGLPTDLHERVVCVTSLFLAVAQETGNTDLAYLGIQLLRAHGVPVQFKFQKQVTLTFSTSSRIQTDWRVRGSGALMQCLPKWREYLRKVRLEVRNRMEEEKAKKNELKEKKHEIDAATTTSNIDQASTLPQSEGLQEAAVTPFSEPVSNTGEPSISAALNENILSSIEARVKFWNEHGVGRKKKMRRRSDEELKEEQKEDDEEKKIISDDTKEGDDGPQVENVQALVM